MIWHGRKVKIEDGTLCFSRESFHEDFDYTSEADNQAFTVQPGIPFVPHEVQSFEIDGDGIRIVCQGGDYVMTWDASEQYPTITQAKARMGK